MIAPVNIYQIIKKHAGDIGMLYSEQYSAVARDISKLTENIKTINISDDLVTKIWNKAKSVGGIEIRKTLEAYNEIQADEVPKQNFWIAYDHQIGKWLVQAQPFEVVRPGMEIIKVQEISRETVPEFEQEKSWERHSPINFDRR